MRLRASALVGCVLALATACDPTPHSMAGKACGSDDDCGAQLCVAEPRPTREDLAPLPLVCGSASDGRAPHEACDRGEQCGLGVCLLAGACARPCAAEAQCETGERCAFVYARTETDALQTLHACVRAVDLPTDAEVQVDVRIGSLHGTLDDVDFPKIAPPTLLVLEHLDDSQWPGSMSTCRPPLCARRLVTRDTAPQVLFDLDAIDADPAGPLNPVANGDHVSPTTLLLPNGPRALLSDTGYRVSLQSELPGDLRITTLHREARGHRLDLNLFYVGARDLAAQDARGPVFVADALEEVDRILGQADIFVGDVRQIDVTGELLARGTPLPGLTPRGEGFTVIRAQYGVYPELPELWKLSAGASNIALNVFFVSDIEPLRDGGDVGAIAGGTPGPLGMHGTAGSGIVVATDMMLSAGDPTRLGRTIAHELGHLLGLFHTNELNGSVFDPLPDTPTCSVDRDSNGDGQLAADECAGHGADNLMFPTTAATSTTLTPQQRDVLRAAIILQ